MPYPGIILRENHANKRVSRECKNASNQEIMKRRWAQQGGKRTPEQAAKDSITAAARYQRKKAEKARIQAETQIDTTDEDI